MWSLSICNDWHFTSSFFIIFMVTSHSSYFAMCGPVSRNKNKLIWVQWYHYKCVLGGGRIPLKINVKLWTDHLLLQNRSTVTKIHNNPQSLSVLISVSFLSSMLPRFKILITMLMAQIKFLPPVQKFQSTRLKEVAAAEMWAWWRQSRGGATDTRQVRLQLNATLNGLIGEVSKSKWSNS